MRGNMRGLFLGLLISALSLALVLYFVDLAALREALRLADYRYLVPAAAAFLVSLVARGLAWRTLLLEGASLQKTFFTVNEGYLLNNVLPFRLGEVGRAFLLSRTVPGLAFWQVASTILIERAFDVAITVGMLLVTLPFVLGAPWARPVAYGMGAIVLLGLVALHLLARYRERVQALYRRAAARWPAIDRLDEERVEAFFTGLEALVDPLRFLRALAWMLVVWALTLLQYYLVLLAFVPSARLLWSAFSLGVTAMGVAVPSSPGYLGVFEAALVGALSVFEGVTASAALAYAVVVHLMYLLITAVLGMWGLVRDGLTLGQVYRTVQREAR